VGKRFNAKDIRKEMFPVYGGKCLLRKADYNWVEKFSQGRSKVAVDARSCAEVSETTVKRHLFCGFRRISKAMGQVYQCWWRICREINILLQFQMSHVLRFVYICDHLLTLPVQKKLKLFSNMASSMFQHRNPTI
jgi:hypothetical protein